MPPVRSENYGNPCNMPTFGLAAGALTSMGDDLPCPAWVGDVVHGEGTSAPLVRGSTCSATSALLRLRGCWRRVIEPTGEDGAARGQVTPNLLRGRQRLVLLAQPAGADALLAWPLPWFSGRCDTGSVSHAPTVRPRRRGPPALEQRGLPL